MAWSWQSYAHLFGFPHLITFISAQCMFQGLATRWQTLFLGFKCGGVFCLIRFFRLAYHMSRLPTWLWLITCRFTVAFSFSPGTRHDYLASQLQQKVLEFRSHFFAESTKKTYKTHPDTLLHFCQYVGYSPAPIQTDHLLQYAAFSRQKPQSIISAELSQYHRLTAQGVWPS